MKRSAEDDDGPGQKHLASTYQQDSQAHRSATPLRTNYPQVPPSVPLSLEQTLQRIRDANTEAIWSGTLEIPNRPHNNDQRQDVDIISGKIHFYGRINTDNWPKPLKMTTISHHDYKKLWSLGVGTQIGACFLFSVDDDCDKMSYGAFIQCTRFSSHVAGLLKYTSSDIQVLFVRSLLLEGDEELTIGCIQKYSNNNSTVKLLTDLGILSHATAYNVLAKENSSLKEELKQKNKVVTSLEEELQQKDKQGVELAIHYQEEMKNLKLIADEKSQEVEALVIARDQIDTQKREIDSLKKESERMHSKEIARLKVKLKQKGKELKDQNLDAEEKLNKMVEEKDALMKENEEQNEDLRKKDIALEDLKEERETLKNAKEKMLQEQQQLKKNLQQKGMEEKTQIMAEAWTNLTKMREDMEAVKEQEKEKLMKEVETHHLELVKVKQTVHNIEQTIERDLKCSICQQLFIKVTTLNCSHSFCAYCILKWQEDHNSCPICRKDIETTVQCLDTDNFIDKIVNHLGDEAKQRRKETVRERNGVDGDEQPDDDDSESDDDTYPAYRPSPAHSLSSVWSRSPTSIANLFSPYQSL